MPPRAFVDALARDARLARAPRRGARSRSSIRPRPRSSPEGGLGLRATRAATVMGMTVRLFWIGWLFHLKDLTNSMFFVLVSVLSR